MIYECWIGNDGEGSSCGLVELQSLNLPLLTEERRDDLHTNKCTWCESNRESLEYLSLNLILDSPLRGTFFLWLDKELKNEKTDENSHLLLLLLQNTWVVRDCTVVPSVF